MIFNVETRHLFDRVRRDCLCVAGAPLPQHAHPHEQVANIIEGEFEMTVGGETRVLHAGAVAVIPSNVPHSGKALTKCYIVDVFYPTGEDLRK